MHPPTNYNSPPLAKFFHALPHVNISLHFVNSTFAPDNDVYLESLGILASIPALWLIFTLLLLLLYLCTRCCDRKPRPKNSIVILKWTLSFFTMFCCGAVGVGLYGNDDVHNGMLELLTAGRAMHETISSVKNQTLAIDSTLKLKVKFLLTQLGDVFDEPVSNQTARAVLLRILDEMTSNTSVALASLQDISRPLNPVTLAPALDALQMAEDIRWPVTMVVLSILLVFCVILLFGVAKHSRCALITFSVFGLFAVIFSWLMASVYLTASVALGDLCETPMVLIKLEAPAPLHHDYLNYYMTCEHVDQNPFWVILLKASKAISNVTDSVNPMTRIARQLYKPSQLHPKLDMLAKEIKLASNLINSLTTKLDCTQIHNQYMAGLHAVCEMALFGLTFMLAASIGAGFLFAILVWLDSHTWIYIRKNVYKKKTVIKFISIKMDQFPGPSTQKSSSTQSLRVTKVASTENWRKLRGIKGLDPVSGCTDSDTSADLGEEEKDKKKVRKKSKSDFITFSSMNVFQDDSFAHLKLSEMIRFNNVRKHRSKNPTDYNIQYDKDDEMEDFIHKDLTSTSVLFDDSDAGSSTSHMNETYKNEVNEVNTKINHSESNDNIEKQDKVMFQSTFGWICELVGYMYGFIMNIFNIMREENYTI